jgi:hypothetical protein
VASAEEFGVPSGSYPVVSVPMASQVCPNLVLGYPTAFISPPLQSTADDPHPLADMLPSPTSSLPNPYTTCLSRTRTASSVASSTRTSSSAEFGPRPRPKLALTLRLPDSKPAISITSIAISDSDAPLPNPYQPQVNLQSYFSPHTPRDPFNSDSPTQSGGTSNVGATGFDVSYFSPHTPATTSLLSNIGTGNRTTIGTGPIGTKREHQGERVSRGRASGLLALPPSVAIESYWSPHSPDVPESVESGINEEVVEEPEDIPVKGSEFLKGYNKALTRTPTTGATDGHSIEPSSISPREPSPHSSNDVFTDADLTASDSSSPLWNKGLVPTKRTKPQLTVQTWNLDRMREEKKRQESVAARRQRSRDKDARNRERNGRKTVQREAETTVQETIVQETIVQTTRAIAGENVPHMLKPGGFPVARPPRHPVVGSNNIPDRQGKSKLSLLPAALRPGSQHFQALPPPAQPALGSQPVLDMPEPAAQRIDTGVGLTQNRHSIATTNAWSWTSSGPPQLSFTLNTAGLSLGTNSDSDRDWFAHGRSPSEPIVPSVSVLGPGDTQGAELGKTGVAKERKKFNFFGNPGGTASDTNLSGLAAASAMKSKDDKDVNDLKENRKSAFYSRDINASFEALVGWGGKIFSSSSTSVNTHGSSKKGEKDEKTSYPGAVPPSATARPHPYAQYQIFPPPAPPVMDIQHNHTTPPQFPTPNTRVYAAPLSSSGERGPSFEDLGVEVKWAGKSRTHTPPHSSHGHGADAQQVKKGPTRDNGGGVSGFMKMFGFKKKDKGKQKQKWF